MALFVQLDVNWPNNDKVIAVGLDGAGLHAVAMCLAKQMETDGVLSRALLTRHGATPELIDRLVDERLFDAVDARRVGIHGWLERNTSAEDFRTHGRRGNHKRYGHPGPFETCPRCNPISPTSGGEGGEGGARGGEQSTGSSTTSEDIHKPEGDSPVNGETPGHSPSLGGATRGRAGGDRGATRPRLLETDSETDSETGGERSARELPDSSDPNDPPTIIEQAYVTLADRRLARDKQTRGPKYRRATIDGIRRDHHDQAHRYMHLNPNLTPAALADLLEPPPGSTAPRTDPLAAQQAALLARTQAGTKAVRELLATEPGDPATNLAAIADARTNLQPHPSTPLTTPNPE